MTEEIQPNSDQDENKRPGAIVQLLSLAAVALVIWVPYEIYLNEFGDCKPCGHVIYDGTVEDGYQRPSQIFGDHCHSCSALENPAFDSRFTGDIASALLGCPETTRLKRNAKAEAINAEMTKRGLPKSIDIIPAPKKK